MLTAQNLRDEYLCNSGKLTNFSDTFQNAEISGLLRDWLFLKNLPIGGQNQQKIGKNSPDEESFPRFGEKEPIEEKCLTENCQTQGIMCA